MTLKRNDRVGETSTTTGTGPFTVSGAIDSSYKTFASRLSVGDTFEGAIVHPGNGFVTGLFTYSAANQVTVTTVDESSNSDAAVSFGAGTKQIFMTMPAKRAGLRSKIVTVTRALSTASGSVAYTGVGFTPTCLIALGYGDNYSSGNAQYTAWGIADSSRAVQGLSEWYSNSGPAFDFDGGAFISISDNAHNFLNTIQRATISSYDSDGFTLVWTKSGNGSASFSVPISVLCLR